MANTQQGAKIQSTWAGKRFRPRIMGDANRKKIQWADDQQAIEGIMRDWMFATPVVSGTNMQINIGDVWRTVDSIKINIGDTWKNVVGAKINIGDTWKTIF